MARAGSSIEKPGPVAVAALGSQREEGWSLDSQGRVPRTLHAATTFPPAEELDEPAAPLRRAHQAPPTTPPDALDEADEESETIERLSHIRKMLTDPAVGPRSRVAAPVPPPRVRGGHDRTFYVLAFLAGLGFGTVGLLLVAPARFADPPPEVVAPAAVSALVDEGFRLVDSDPATALLRFREALARDTNLLSATTGVGLAHLALGDRDEARSWLCRASTSQGAFGSSARDALRRAGISCR